MIDVRAPQMEGRQMEPGACLVEGDERFMNTTDLHPWLNALVTFDDRGKGRVAVLNTTGQDVVIQKGQHYGTATLLTTPDSQDLHPGRICVLEPGQPG